MCIIPPPSGHLEIFFPENKDVAGGAKNFLTQKEAILRPFTPFSMHFLPFSFHPIFSSFPAAIPPPTIVYCIVYIPGFLDLCIIWLINNVDYQGEVKIKKNKHFMKCVERSL